MNEFLVEVQANDDVTIGGTYSSLVQAFSLFRQALCQDRRAKLFGLAVGKQPLLICDTQFYKSKS